MKRHYKIIIGALLLVAAGALGLWAYIKSVAPPGEEWLAYDNEQVLETIDRQLAGWDMAQLAEKEAWVLEKSVAQLQQAVWQGDLTYEELSAVYLSRIKRLDQCEKGYNAVVTVAADALEQARACDWERQHMQDAGKGWQERPLLGMPMLWKDNINTQNLATSGGVEAFGEYVPASNAEVVRTLRQQGVVILGKANLSELAYFVSSVMPSGYSGRKGQTVNPFGPLKLSPSGSSSGSAVAVTANLAPLAMGTETAGSIAGPAAANSVVGFKPSRSKVSAEGIWPLVAAVDTAGPLSKTVADAALVYSALTGEALPAWDEAKLEHAVLGLVSYAYNDPKELARLREQLESLGAQVVEVSIEQGAAVQNLIPLTFKRDFEAFAQAQQLPITDLAELIAYNEADARRRIRYGQDLLEQAQAASADEQPLKQEIALAKEQLNTLFAQEKLTAIVYLTTSASSVVAAAGCPQLTVPFGADQAGAPLGVTFAALSGQDAELLELGWAFEQAVQGRLQP